MQIDTYLNSLRRKGKYAFSLHHAHQHIGKSLHNVKIRLARLSRKGKVMSVYKGFYIIIPPEYYHQGVLPPALFIDDLMNYLDKPYYVALQSAAAYFGAAHYQPQAFSIMTSIPNLRSLKKKGIWIRFISTRQWPEKGIIQKKSDAGYLNVSSPSLTALDLVKFQNTAGGLSQVMAILSELIDEIDPDSLYLVAHTYQQTVALQRLGYLLDVVFDKPEFAKRIKQALENRNMFMTPLMHGGQENLEQNATWKIKVNTEIEVEL